MFPKVPFQASYYYGQLAWRSSRFEVHRFSSEILPFPECFWCCDFAGSSCFTSRFMPLIFMPLIWPFCDLLWESEGIILFRWTLSFGSNGTQCSIMVHKVDKADFVWLDNLNAWCWIKSSEIQRILQKIQFNAAKIKTKKKLPLCSVKTNRQAKIWDWKSDLNIAICCSYPLSFVEM